ncbi:hypothetical protein ACFZDG_26780 [Kitasatospora xanthocidica]
MNRTSVRFLALSALLLALAGATAAATASHGTTTHVVAHTRVPE